MFSESEALFAAAEQKRATWGKKKQKEKKEQEDAKAETSSGDGLAGLTNLKISKGPLKGSGVRNLSQSVEGAISGDKEGDGPPKSFVFEVQ